MRSGSVLLLGRGRRSEEVEVNLQTNEFSRISSLWGKLNMRTKVFGCFVCGAVKGVSECVNTLDRGSRPGGTRSNSLWNLQQCTDHLVFIQSAPF